MKCPKCHAALPAGARFNFCPFCGSALGQRVGGDTEPYAAADALQARLEADTVAEIPALAETAVGPAVVPVETPSLSASEAPTRLDLPAVQVPGDVDRSTDNPAVPAAGQTPPESAQPERSAPPSSGEARRFSETAWFMAAVDDELAEGEAQSFSEQELMTERYASRESLPRELRKGFSLTLDETDAVSDEALSDDP